MMESTDEEGIPQKRHEKGFVDSALNLFGVSRCEGVICIIITIVLLVVLVVGFVYLSPIIQSGVNLLGDLEGGIGAGLDDVGNGLERAFTDIASFGTELICDIEDIFDENLCPPASLLPCCSSLNANVIAAYLGRGITSFCTFKGDSTKCKTASSCISTLGVPPTQACSPNIIRLTIPVASCDRRPIRQIIDCQLSAEDAGAWIVDTANWAGTATPSGSVCCSQWTTNALLAGISRGYTEFCISNTFQKSCNTGPFTCVYNTKLSQWLGHEVQRSEYVVTPSLLSCESVPINVIKNGELIYPYNNTAYINPKTGAPYNGI